MLTDNPGTLTNDFFVNLLDMGTEWSTSPKDDGTFVGKDRATGQRSGPAAGSTWCSVRIPNYGRWPRFTQRTTPKKFVKDFVAAWAKVMDLDRF